MKNIFAVILLVCGVFHLGTLQAANDKRKGTISTPSAVVYALPQTVLDVEVIAEKIIQKRGPLADYAQKYLDVKELVESDGVVWKIKGIRIQSHAEVDPSQFYKVKATEDYEPNLISLKSSGLIEGFNIEKAAIHKEVEQIVKFVQEEEASIEYGLFGLDHNLKFKEDTIYKVVETDTAFVKVPVLEKQSQLKSLEEKAEEAAHQIYKLRKRRFKILTANYEVLPPDGKAYEVLIRELGQLEKDYLSLFVGKSSKSLETFHFSYVPKLGEDSGVVFRMSKDKGPLAKNDLTGRPVMLELEDFKSTKELPSLQAEEQTPGEKIYYRIPGQAFVKVVYGKKVLGQKVMTIAQLGKIQFFPADVLINEGYSIEFHPEYGSVKNIGKQ